jgi:hypothetical protein
VNVIFLSPHFPPQFQEFCRALRNEGATVLGLGDTPEQELSPQLRAVLSGYYYAPDMHRYDEVIRAMGYFTWRFGRIDRIDSLNEHWLELEARLREDFNLFGQRPSDTAKNRSKTGMREIFRAAGVPCTEGARLTSNDHAWALVREFGFPVVFKPDVGVGAAFTFKVSNEKELAAALQQPLAGYVVEKFEPGGLISYDGLCTRDGQIVFSISHVYSAGVMDIVTNRLTMHYYSLREIPPELEALGRKVVKAFNIRERFFHVEFFHNADGFKALEINVRPPGGFTTDLMNFSCDIDIYALWAKVLTGKSLEGWSFQRKYCCAHAGRRYNVKYRYSHAELLERLGSKIVAFREMPPILAGAMGDFMYIVRDPDEGALKEAIRLIETTG